MTTLDWIDVVHQLIRAIGLARDAYAKTRRPRDRLSDQETDRLRNCELEIAKYIRSAQHCVDRERQSSASITDVDWRRVVLDLFRAHSLVWETLWIKYHGIPKVERGRGLGEAGEEITRSVITAVEALAATNPDFCEVDWNGREILRPSPLPVPRR